MLGLQACSTMSNSFYLFLELLPEPFRNMVLLCSPIGTELWTICSSLLCGGIRHVIPRLW